MTGLTRAACDRKAIDEKAGAIQWSRVTDPKATDRERQIYGAGIEVGFMRAVIWLQEQGHLKLND